MIAYKVVTIHRGSIMVNKFKDSIGSFEKNKYHLEYPQGKTIIAIKGTLGIFCFKTEKDAKNWIDFGKILKVRPLTKGHKPKHFQKGISELCINNFYANPKIYNVKLPKGTICFDKVKVLN